MPLMPPSEPSTTRTAPSPSSLTSRHAPSRVGWRSRNIKIMTMATSAKAASTPGGNSMSRPSTGKRGGVVGDLAEEVPRGPLVARLGWSRGKMQTFGVNVLVRHGREEVGNHVDPCRTLVVGLDYPPGSLIDVGVDEHLVLRAGELHPSLPSPQVVLRELPRCERILQPLAEPALLLLVADREQVLAEQDP